MLNFRKNIKKISPAYFIRESEIQGLSNIFRSQRRIFKVIWTFLFLISFSICCYFLSEIATSFYNYEVVTTIKTINEVNLTFPTVSFCQYDNKNFQFKVDENTSFYNREKIKKWQDQIESFIDTEYGKCYSFNSGRNYSGLKTPIKNIKSRGYYYGLILNLNVETISDFVELTIIIHQNSPGSPNIYNKGYRISSGSFNYFIVNKINEKKLQEPYNNCLDDVNEFKKNKTIIEHIKSLNHTYEKKDCMVWCKIIKYLETASCNCSLNKLDHQIELIEYCLEPTQSCTEMFVDNFNDDCEEFCPSLCVTIEYDVTFYSEYIPNFGKIISNPLAEFVRFESYENISKKFVSFSVYFDDIKYTQINQEEKMKPFDFVSNIGNVFGLFLGMGLLSFIEIIEIIIEFIIYIIFK